MQRVIQRSQRAKRGAIRRAAKRAEDQSKTEEWERKQMRIRLNRVNIDNIRDARKRRQEDWIAGPLAPRRDVGEKASTYGTISLFDLRPPDQRPDKRLKWYHIAEGDRVVVTTGREKGKIGVVTDLNKEKDTVNIRGVRVVDVSVPEWLQQEEGTGPIASVPASIPISDVKLVYPLPDPVTGVPRDVVIDRLAPIKSDDLEPELHRVIPGTRTVIPWPETGDEIFQDYDDDTLRITVEEQTFRPFLLYPPMPVSVIDELRGRYSRFRTRHDWDYVQKKEAEDARMEKRKQLGKRMQTPLQELAELRQKQKAMTRKELTDEQLAKIGQIMLEERQKSNPQTAEPTLEQ